MTTLKKCFVHFIFCAKKLGGGGGEGGGSTSRAKPKTDCGASNVCIYLPSPSRGDPSTQVDVPCG